MATPHHLGWHQIIPGHWERKIEGFDAFFAVAGVMGSGREGFIPSCHVSLSVPPSISEVDLFAKLRTAWIRFRFQQPQLAATSDPMRSVLIYKTFPAASIDKWADESFNVLYDATDARSAFPYFPSAHAARLYYIPASRQLVLRIPHWIADAIGALTIFKQYLQFLEEGTVGVWGEEVVNLAPTSEELWECGGDLDESLTSEANQIISTYHTGHPGQGPAILGTSATTTPSQCEYVSLELDDTTTALVIQACRARGVTVPAAVHAAYALSNDKHCDPLLKQKAYESWIVTNLRDFLPSTYDPVHHSCSLQMVLYPLHIDMPSTFDHASALIQDYTQNTVKAGIRNDPKFTGYMQRAWVPPIVYATIPFQVPMISSLGVLDKYFPSGDSEIKVVDFDLGCDVVGEFGIFHYWTWGGKLQMRYSYNASFMETELAKSLLEDTKAYLVKGLGVAM